MKLITFSYQNEHRLGVLTNDDQRVIDVKSYSPESPALNSMEALINSGQGGLDLVSEIADTANDTIAISDVSLRFPMRPVQLRDALCFEEHLQRAFTVARNLAISEADDPELARRQVEEKGLFQIPDTWYKQPIYYKGNRFATSGPEEDIPWPQYSILRDYELEMACWIGTEATDVDKEDASTHIFGYSVFNDFSARDAQIREMPGNLGPAKSKDFNKANALGPCIVTADSIDPYNLTMVARVNGEEWSRNSSSTMFWRFEDVIEHISQSETLYPGEVIGSGTVGKGCGLELERFLAEGDVVELEIEGIGILRNRVIGPK